MTITHTRQPGQSLIVSGENVQVTMLPDNRLRISGASSVTRKEIRPSQSVKACVPATKGFYSGATDVASADVACEWDVKRNRWFVSDEQYWVVVHRENRPWMQYAPGNAPAWLLHDLEENAIEQLERADVRDSIAAALPGSEVEALCGVDTEKE